MGKVFKAVTQPVKSLLFGKEVGPDAEAGELRQNQLAASQGMAAAVSKARQRADEDPTALLQGAAQQQVRGLTATREDAQRRAQELIRQRGLGNTSAGLAQRVGIDRNIGEQIAATRAGIPLKAYEMKRQSLMDLANISQGSLGSQNVPINFNKTKKGGISELLGAGAGAYFGKGDPNKAGMGAGIGKAFGNAFG